MVSRVKISSHFPAWALPFAVHGTWELSKQANHQSHAEGLICGIFPPCVCAQEMARLKASAHDAKVLRMEARRIAKEGDALLASLHAKVKAKMGGGEGGAKRGAAAGRASGEGGLCGSCIAFEGQINCLKAEVRPSPITRQHLAVVFVPCRLSPSLPPSFLFSPPVAARHPSEIGHFS